MKPCPACMTLRGRFVSWLGIKLGVMKRIDNPTIKKEEPMTKEEETKINAMFVEFKNQVTNACTTVAQLQGELAFAKYQLDEANKKIDALTPKKEEGA